MNWEIKFGRRRNDGMLIVPPDATRFLLRVDVRWMVGTPLETLTPNSKGQFISIVLVNKAWYPHLYFLNERAKWDEDDYFNYAQEKLRNR